MEGNVGGLKGIDDVEVAGKRVLVRVDLNVPLVDGEVGDATRIDRVMPTIRDLKARGARVVVLSHFDRPKGERREDMSLRPVARAMQARLGGAPFRFAEDCVGSAAHEVVDGLVPGEVALLENLRFHPGEEANDPEFARLLAELGDIYVNDAFSSAHRGHASTEALARLLPACAGRLMKAEIEALTRALEAPERPVAAVVGGAKVSTKIPVLKNMVSKVDALIIGGGMANTFLMAQGIEIGRSLAEPDYAETARGIMTAARAGGCDVVLPGDAVVAREFAAHAAHQTCPIGSVPADHMILDVGPETVTKLGDRLGGCRTLVWNGPLGAFEIAPFGEGTFQLARAAAELTRQGRLVSVAGGGDTVAALKAAGVADDFSYISTAGGAFLEWLEGRVLPGVAVLLEQ